MLHIVFCDKLLTPAEAKQRLVAQGVRFLGTFHEYPERAMARRDYDAFMRRVAHLLKIGSNQTIVTDSDLLFTVIRIFIKRGMICFTDVVVHVFDGEDYVQIKLTDRAFTSGEWPKLLGCKTRLVAELLDQSAANAAVGEGQRYHESSRRGH